VISFTDYAKIANNYCICYFGQSDECLVQLRLIRPFLQRQFPDLNIYIGCKDDKTHYLKNCEKILKISDLKIRKSEFAYISEVKSNGQTHPIEDLLVGAGIINFSIPTPIIDKTQKCVIVSKSTFPAKPLDKSQIEKLKLKASGMFIEIDTDISGAGLVMGVESPELCEAAAKGIETVLVPTGVGSRLYKKLFPNLEVLHI
jgi:hypothetical protein